MHRLIAVLAITFFHAGAIGQSNFEGKVTYRMTISQEPDSSTVEALFGNQKIKVLVNPGMNKPGDREDLLLDFEKGILYKLTNHSKRFTVDSLKPSSNDMFSASSALVKMPAQRMKQLGYTTTAFSLPLSGDTAAPASQPFILLRYADSLFYKIPAQFASVDMVPLFTNGNNVGFGMKMVVQSGENNHTDSSEFRIIAVAPRAVPDSLLQIPAGYLAATADIPAESSLQLELDTMAMMDVPVMDSGSASVPVKPADHPRKTGKRKQIGSQKTASPARKPRN